MCFVNDEIIQECLSFDDRKEMEKKYMENYSPQNIVKYCPKVLLKYLLSFLHYFLRYCILILTFLAEFKRVYGASTRRFSGGLSYDYLQQDIGNLSKLPKHMSFVINEDVATNYCDVANLICWTIAMGIPYISLYDRHGIFKASECRLRQIIRDKVNSLFGSNSPKIDVIVKDSSQTYKNGVVHPKRFCVQLLNEEDGKADIAVSARKIASMYTAENITLEQVDVDFIDKKLKAIQNIPDPDLVVQFGPVKSLMGFLPWQTRLSEILHFPTHKNLSYESFRHFLHKYSKCDQRLGK